MGAPPKLTAREAFDLNLEDAEILVDLAKTLVNNRQRRMRREAGKTRRRSLPAAEVLG